MPGDPVKRKVIGNKFLVTLPFKWRSAFNLRTGDVVDLHFDEPGAPLIIVPSGRELTEIQRGLIELLITMPSADKIEAVMNQLGWMRSAYQELLNVST